MEDFMLKKVAVEDFSDVYPRMNKYIVDNGEVIESRNGICREVLDFSTTLLKPQNRCVGVLGRNMNIFFLIAEAIWIAAGRKDVKWLNIFNSNMKNYSDDGKVFHAPYGYRLRHWGCISESGVSDYRNVPSIDQVALAIRILTDDPNSRQVVLSIWNPDLDLGFKTKDLPCNDILMLKIRNGKLITTVANRSNDLHLGLPTNIFQFSFLSEIIARCLGIELGTQTHHSQSLHVYTDMNDIWKKIMINDFNAEYITIYDYSNFRDMDFNFANSLPVTRLVEIDYFLNIVISNVIRRYNMEGQDKIEIDNLKNFSKFLYDCFRLLCCYVDYKRESKMPHFNKDSVLIDFIDRISSSFYSNWDFAVMAKNFFATRLSEGKNNFKIIGTL